MGSNPGAVYWMDIFSHYFVVKITCVKRPKITEQKMKNSKSAVEWFFTLTLCWVLSVIKLVLNRFRLFFRPAKQVVKWLANLETANDVQSGEHPKEENFRPVCPDAEQGFLNGPFPASFCSFYIPIQMTNIQLERYKLKKHRWCAWNSNPWRQDGRRRKIHWDMAAPYAEQGLMRDEGASDGELRVGQENLRDHSINIEVIMHTQRL